ncbi:MAG: cbb3-type cytochrome oxidase subunit 3 [Aeromonas sp.]
MTSLVFDYNLLRGLYTLGLLILMLAIFVWAFSAKRQAAFNAAAQLVFDEPTPAPSPDKESGL